MSLQALCAQADLHHLGRDRIQHAGGGAETAQHIRPGTVFLDLNSASPGTKQQAALPSTAQAATMWRPA
jgi:hypothetical protein